MKTQVLQAFPVILLAIVLLGGVFFLRGREGAVQADPGNVRESVTVRLMTPAGKLGDPVETSAVKRTASEWKADLDPKQYYVLREKGTERAHTGALADNKAQGIYACAGCGLPLFESATKFESGTGWPSFYAPMAKENVAEESDTTFGMIRTEVLCTRCEGHLGHVFDDGPAPTGLRYCMNSAALRFVPSEEAATLAEEAKPVEKNSSAPGKWLPMPEKDTAKTAEAGEARAIFAGGCFWCTEAVFQEVPGVKQVVSGYTGGNPERADYESVSTGSTGHAEAIEITYDTAQVTFGQLLRIFFATHDPTTLNRQGPDRGTQYRSGIYFTDAEQETIASGYIAQLDASGKFSRPIVTEVKALETFHTAEEYHQDFVKKQPNNSYVRYHALPKVEKVREMLGDAAE